MRFARSEEQVQLADTVRALLTKRSDSAAVRAAIGTERGYDEALWGALCEQIGVAALCVPEEYDGVGAGLVETAIVLEELGANLAPAPLLANALTAVALLTEGTEDERAERLPGIAAGEVTPYALDEVTLEPASDRAGHDPAHGAMDPTLRLAPGGRAPSGPMRDVAIALVSALQVGAMQRALDMTVAYSKERVQFGRPIGSFQALKHRMADMLVRLEASRSASWAATYAAAAYAAEPTDEHAAELARMAGVARRYCGPSLEHIASETVQLHGGIAITWEHDAHLVFKRAHALNALIA
jgi:alkylation response protein AidB-like acyl-CoA dehydrogenase